MSHSERPVETSTTQTRGHWREYRLGPVTEAAYVTTSTLVACAVGLGASFAVVLLIGLLGEEGLVPELGEVIDQVSRASMGVILGATYLIVVVLVVAHSVRSEGVSRALVRAADDGAEPRAVPHPTQVEQVVLPPHLPLVFLLGFHVLVGGCAVWVAATEYPTAILPSVAVTVAAALGIVAVYRVAVPAHTRRRRRIAEHWTAHVEETAWGHARQRSGGKRTQPRHAELVSALDADKGERDGRVGRGRRLLLAGTVLGVLAGFVVETFLLVRHPGTTRYPGSTLADRADYSGLTEAILDGAVWLGAALGIAGIAIALVGAVVEAAGLTAERAALVERLESGRGGRPPAGLLSRYAERRPADLAQLAAGLGAFCLVPSLAVLQLATVDSDTFLDSVAQFSGVRPHATVGVVLGALLVVTAFVANTISNRRGHPLRERLQQQWPTLPRRPDDKDSAKYAVRTKPTLRRDDL